MTCPWELPRRLSPYERIIMNVGAKQGDKILPEEGVRASFSLSWSFDTFRKEALMWNWLHVSTADALSSENKLILWNTTTPRQRAWQTDTSYWLWQNWRSFWTGSQICNLANNTILKNFSPFHFLSKLMQRADKGDLLGQLFVVAVFLFRVRNMVHKSMRMKTLSHASPMNILHTGGNKLLLLLPWLFWIEVNQRRKGQFYFALVRECPQVACLDCSLYLCRLCF